MGHADVAFTVADSTPSQGVRRSCVTLQCYECASFFMIFSYLMTTSGSSDCRQGVCGGDVLGLYFGGA